MFSPGPKIVLFRSSQKDDPFEALFAEAGWQAQSVPVLAFRYLNKTQLHEKLSGGASYAGIIVTSPRAGDILGSMLSSQKDLYNAWEDKPIVCIGSRTAASLIDANLTPVISNHASGEAVAKRVSHLDNEGCWLFLCGNLRREELPANLTAANIPFNELVIYKTLPSQNLQLTNVSKPEWVVFFSPSGVRAVKKVWPADWNQVNMASIGQTTASAIEAAGWHVAAIAEKPVPESVLEAVTQFVGN